MKLLKRLFCLHFNWRDVGPAVDYPYGELWQCLNCEKVQRFRYLCPPVQFIEPME